MYYSTEAHGFACPKVKANRNRLLALIKKVAKRKSKPIHDTTKIRYLLNLFFLIREDDYEVTVVNGYLNNLFKEELCLILCFAFQYVEYYRIFTLGGGGVTPVIPAFVSPITRQRVSLPTYDSEELGHCNYASASCLRYLPVHGQRSVYHYVKNCRA